MIRHLLVFAILLMPTLSQAEIGIKAALIGGSTSNLFSDSSQQQDTYTAASVTAKAHPLSFAEISVTGEYTWYSQVTDISNLLFGAGLSIIPLPDSSRFSLFLSANFQVRNYRERETVANANEFNSDDYNLLLSGGYVVSSRLHLRSGFRATVSGFDSERVDDRESHQLFSGLNLTLPGQHVLDVESGYSWGNVQTVSDWDDEYDVSRGVIKQDSAYVWLREGDLNSWYVSPRLSRPLGTATGLSVTWSRREFVMQPEDGFVYGYSSGYLSPWISSYEGDVIQLNLKTFLIPRLIVTAGFGYAEKRFLDVVEMKVSEDIFTGDTISVLTALNNISQRQEFQRRAFLGLQLPRPTSRDLFWEPSLRFEFISNSSAIVVYDYDLFSISSSVALRF